MRFEILTLFPETFEGFLRSSLIGKAVAKGALEIHLHNIRDFAPNRRQADDRPYGGGPGMVLMAEPIYQALRHIKKNCLKKSGVKKTAAYILSPRGNILNARTVRALAKNQTLILLAGHYEGVDERVKHYFDGELSIGPYVTMGGEVPAMAAIEAVSRFIPDVIGNPNSLEQESGHQYTRPSVWKGKKVPPVLLSGDHARIKEWRLGQAKKTPRP